MNATFKCSPPGRTFGWKGKVYASDRESGILVVEDEGFANALREMAKSDSIVEVTGEGSVRSRVTEPAGPSPVQPSGGEANQPEGGEQPQPKEGGKKK